MQIKMKTVVTYQLKGKAETHARTAVSVRDQNMLIDEPVERGGTNQAPTPTETMLAALAGCTNVITQKIAKKHGIEIMGMDIDVSAKFDRRGVTLEEEVAVPFPEIDLKIKLTTNADESDIEVLKTDLQKYCAVSKVIRESGSLINEDWIVQHP